MLDGESKVFRHGKAKTLYLSIPSKIADDSAFTIQKGDTVNLHFNPEVKQLIIQKKEDCDSNGS